MIQCVAQALRESPSPKRLDPAIKYWKCTLSQLTGGNRKAWARGIFHNLSQPSTPSDVMNARLRDYTTLGGLLEEVATIARKVLNVAFKADPSGRRGVYLDAMNLDRDSQKLETIISEMVIVRRSGIQYLIDAERKSELMFQT